jgi:hypothetical protein
MTRRFLERLSKAGLVGGLAGALFSGDSAHVQSKQEAPAETNSSPVANKDAAHGAAPPDTDPEKTEQASEAPDGGIEKRARTFAELDHERAVETVPHYEDRHADPELNRQMLQDLSSLQGLLAKQMNYNDEPEADNLWNGKQWRGLIFGIYSKGSECLHVERNKIDVNTQKEISPFEMSFVICPHETPGIFLVKINDSVTTQVNVDNVRTANIHELLVEAGRWFDWYYREEAAVKERYKVEYDDNSTTDDEENDGENMAYFERKAAEERTLAVKLKELDAGFLPKFKQAMSKYGSVSVRWDDDKHWGNPPVEVEEE